MAKKFVYAVVCYWGKYDDYDEVIEKVFDSKIEAEAFVRKQDKKYVSYRIDKVEKG